MLDFTRLSDFRTIDDIEDETAVNNYLHSLSDIVYNGNPAEHYIAVSQFESDCIIEKSELFEMITYMLEGSRSIDAIKTASGFYGTVISHGISNDWIYFIPVENSKLETVSGFIDKSNVTVTIETDCDYITADAENIKFYHDAIITDCDIDIKNDCITIDAVWKNHDMADDADMASRDGKPF